MSDFFSFVVMSTKEGLQYFTDKSLVSHSSAISLHRLVGIIREIEWDNKDNISLRLLVNESESVQDYFETEIRKSWASRQALVNNEIEKHLRAGRLPDITKYVKTGFDWRLCLVAFAEHVLPIFESRFPNDNRVRNCIQSIRDFINGKITKEELITIRKAAYAAAYAATYAATDAAAYAATDDAAYAAAYAADAAAYAAAYATAYAAAHAADAADAAAYAAADDATYAAADASRAKEKQWQIDYVLSAIKGK